MTTYIIRRIIQAIIILLIVTFVVFMVMRIIPGDPILMVAFGPLADAYETLIRDVVIGDQTLFVCDNEVENAWRIYDDLLSKDIEIFPYQAGTWGPAEIDRLQAPWFNP